ncbi:MAG: DUF5719 family protein [Mycobacteriales bacterium]
MSGDDEDREYREELTVHWRVNAEDLPAEDGYEDGYADGPEPVGDDADDGLGIFDLDEPSPVEEEPADAPGTDLVLVPRDEQPPIEVYEKSRRHLRPRLRRPSRHAMVPLGLVVLLALGVGAAEWLPGGEREAAARNVDVASVQRWCPPAPPGSALVAASLPSGRSTGKPVLAAGPIAGLPILPLAVDASTLVNTPVPDAHPLVRASGPLAAGFQATEVSRTGGLAVTACGTPDTEAYYLGGRAFGDGAVTVQIANVDSSSAEFELAFWGGRGAIGVPGYSDVVMDPHTTRTVALKGLPAGADLLGLRVRALTGRVASAVYTSQPTHGEEWLPRIARLGNDLLLPGYAAGTPGRSVLLLNPGDAPVTVAVTGVSTGGEDPVAGLQNLSVPANSTRQVDLSGMPADASAVRLHASAPVAAAALADAGRDFALTGPADRLTGPGVVGPATTANGAAVRLVLMARGGEAWVRIRPLAVAGRPAPAPVETRVPADGATVVDPARVLGIAPGGPVPCAVEPVSGKGRVYAAVVFVEGNGAALAALPVTAAELRVAARPVRRDPAASLPY